MGYSATVLCDSVSPAGHRLTTFEVTFPRMVLAEFNTHRVFSRNSASSRAIPVIKQLQRVLDDPFVPEEFGSNQPGMQAGPALGGRAAQRAREQWLAARDSAVDHVVDLVSDPSFRPLSEGRSLGERIAALAQALDAGRRGEDWLNVHKQLANRLLEPFMWHTLIVTATEWENFWHLRAHPDAQPEIRRIAEMMMGEWARSVPAPCDADDWHLPLVDDAGRDAGLRDDPGRAVRVCVGRCARVSYLTHAGVRDPEADLVLHDRLLTSGHLSPFEHPARPLSAKDLAESEWSGNFRGWRAYRKDLPGEADPLGVAAPALAAEPVLSAGSR